MIKILDAQFVTTAVAPAQYPEGDVPEIAFVGRSNVGKSSMINALAGRKKLVRVSNTPGRTRTLNFFEVSLERDGERQKVRLADLPGYGFAKAPKTERQKWREMISTYLDERKPLRIVVSIVDAEVGPTAEDLATLDYLAEKKARLLVVATKIDRLPKAKRKPAVKALAARLEVPEEVVIPFSATDRIGIDEVWEALLGALAAPTA